MARDVTGNPGKTFQPFWRARKSATVGPIPRHQGSAILSAHLATRHPAVKRLRDSKIAAASARKTVLLLLPPVQISPSVFLANPLFECPKHRSVCFTKRR